MPHEDLPRLQRQDIEEKRPKCDVCGYELTIAEILTTHNRCVFHAKEGLDILKKLTHFRYIKLLLGDLDVARGKIAMKRQGLTEVDFMACLTHVKPELRELDTAGFKKLCDFMKKHKGAYEHIGS